MPVYRVRHRGALAVLLSLVLPRIGDYMTAATVRAIYAAEGSLIRPNAKLLDIAIDLSEAIPHDCPPISQFRIALRDQAWLRRFDVSVGNIARPGAILGLFSSNEGEPLDGVPARAIRLSVAGIVDQSSLWDIARS